MAFKCDICGKGRTIGKSGAHKYGGKWARRAAKKTRIWKPNLQNYTVNGKKMRLCTRCIKRIKFDKRIKADGKQMKAEKQIKADDKQTAS